VPENCPVPANSSGCIIAKNICSFTLPFGRVKAFKAYFETSEHSSVLRSELQASGVTLVDCPHNGKKEVADKIILGDVVCFTPRMTRGTNTNFPTVDVMAHAIDNPVGSTIVLITGDRDFAYALSTLSLRRYQVVLIAGSNARPSLTMQANIRYDWVNDIVRLSGAPSPQPAQKSCHSSNLQYQGERSGASLTRNSCSCIPVMDSVDMGTRSTGETAVDTAQFRNRTTQPGRPFAPSQSQAAQSTRQEYREVLPTTTNANSAAPLSPPTIRHRSLSSAAATIYQDNPPRVNPPVTRSQIPPFDSPRPSLPLDNDRMTTQLMQPISSTETPKDVRQDTQAEKKTDPPKPTTTARNGPSLSEAAPITTHAANIPLESNASMDVDSKLNFLQASPAENRYEGKTDVPVSVPQPPASTLPTKEQPTRVTSAPSAVDLGVISPQPPKPATPTIPVHRKADEAKPPCEPAANTQSTGSPPLVTPPIFAPLVEILQSHLSKGIVRPLRGTVALQIPKETYQRAGVSRFSQYMAAAHAAGIIELGGRSGYDWVGLQPRWFNAVVAPPQ